MMPDIDKEEQKSLLKEAFHEWLDYKWAEFGKWTAKGLATAAIGSLLYFIATHGGWK